MVYDIMLYALCDMFQARDAKGDSRRDAKGKGDSRRDEVDASML